jgi:hypothetical protein
MATQELIYKVQDTATGLYSTGGHDPKWTRDGKVWKTRGQLLASLKQYKKGRWTGQGYEPREIPSTWTIVDFKLVTVKRQRAHEAVK